MSHKNLPVYPDDHHEFKKMALDKGISMKGYFRSIIERLKKESVVITKTPLEDTL